MEIREKEQAVENGEKNVVMEICEAELVEEKEQTQINLRIRSILQSYSINPGPGQKLGK